MRSINTELIAHSEENCNFSIYSHFKSFNYGNKIECHFNIKLLFSERKWYHVSFCISLVLYHCVFSNSINSLFHGILFLKPEDQIKAALFVVSHTLHEGNRKKSQELSTQ